MANSPARPGSDRQAKIAAAGSPQGGGANKIIIAAVVLILAIIGVVGAVIATQVSSDKEARGSGSEVPAGATMGGGYPVFTDVTAKPGAPTVDIYEDFQCPACAQFETILGPTFAELAQSGDITLRYHVKNFLDDNLRNDGSTKAGNGAFCAADQGKFLAFHDAAYGNQPPESQTGWTSAALTAVAQDAGLTGDALATWQKCVEVGKYTTYIDSVEKQSFADGVRGTPTVRVNGKDVDNREIGSPELLKAYLAAVTQ